MCNVMIKTLCLLVRMYGVLYGRLITIKIKILNRLIITGFDVLTSKPPSSKLLTLVRSPALADLRKLVLSMSLVK